MERKGGTTTRMLLAALAVALVAALTQLPAAAASNNQTADVLDWDTAAVLDGDVSLKRTPGGIKASFSVDAPAGHMMTAWFVVFNNPEECDADPGGVIKCGEADIFHNGDVDATITRITGHVIGNGGFNGSGHASVGKDPVGAERLDGVFTGGGKVNMPLSNPLGAEVHIVWEDHGPLDPGSLPAEIQLGGAQPIAFALFTSP